MLYNSRPPSLRTPRIGSLQGGSEQDITTEIVALAAKVDGLKDTIGELDKDTVKNAAKKEQVVDLAAKVQGLEDTIGKLDKGYPEKGLCDSSRC